MSKPTTWIPTKSRLRRRHNKNAELCEEGAGRADDRLQWTPWNSWSPLPTTSANNAYIYGGRDTCDSSASGSEAEEAVASEESSEDEDESDEDYAVELADGTCTDEGDQVDWNSAVTSAIDSLREAQAAVAKLTGCCPGSGGTRSQGLPITFTELNQSASEAAADADKRWVKKEALENCSAARISPQEAAMGLKKSSSDRDTGSKRREDAAAAGGAGCGQQKLKLATCEIDVIGQRLSSCLQQFQGEPVQNCGACLSTLSTCDPSQLSSRDLMTRLNNLETLLLYLQIYYRSGMSCKRLKLMCQLKRIVGCMHGFLLKRQSMDSLAEAEQLHRKLDDTGDFRRHWRLIPPGGEKFRIVTDSLDCVPRVEVEDEWLRRFLPEAEKVSLGHILADSDPTAPDWLGKQMSFSKLRGRSTRLNSIYSRDAYEDMLRHYLFALK